MTNPLNLDIRERMVDERTAVITLAGEMDMYTTPQARELIESLLAKGVSRFVINLKQTGYLDSTALGMLKGTLENVRHNQGTLRLVSPPARVRRMLEITGLINIFPVDETEQEAMEQLRAAGKDGK